LKEVNQGTTDTTQLDKGQLNQRRVLDFKNKPEGAMVIRIDLMTSLRKKREATKERKVSTERVAPNQKILHQMAKKEYHKPHQAGGTSPAGRAESFSKF